MYSDLHEKMCCTECIGYSSKLNSKCTRKLNSDIYIFNDIIF